MHAKESCGKRGEFSGTIVVGQLKTIGKPQTGNSLLVAFNQSLCTLDILIHSRVPAVRGSDTLMAIHQQGEGDQYSERGFIYYTICFTIQ